MGGEEGGLKVKRKEVYEEKCQKVRWEAQNLYTFRHNCVKRNKWSAFSPRMYLSELLRSLFAVIKN